MDVARVCEDGDDPWELIGRERPRDYDFDGHRERLQRHDDATHDDDGLQNAEYAWDDVNDIELPMELVKKARKEEMMHMKGNIFKVVKKSEAWQKTGRPPISTKWVDTDKTHGTGKPMVRSRWVARDFKDPRDKDREDLFSATPPIEMMRYMLSRQATRRPDGRQRKTLYIDIKKAHLAPLCESDVYVELPTEAEVHEDECGKLIHWLYGCRPAAQAWEEHYSALLVKEGFRRMQTVPVVFVHEQRDLCGVVHGDDFVWVGLDDDLSWVLKVLENAYELKNRGRLGLDEGDLRKIDILGRIIEINDEGITWKGDPRHLDILKGYFGMNDRTKALTKNGYDDDREQGGRAEEDDELTGVECKNFRTLAARLNYMAQDNPTIQFPAKEVCRRMAKPRPQDFASVKRIVRFMMGVPIVKFEFKWQEESEAKRVQVFVDSDWAGCKVTRKSTSGGVLKVGQHIIRTWSSTQSTVATSSGEAELLSMYDGAARGVGLLSILSEMGVAPVLSLVQVRTDSAVAKSFTATRGLGKMRHVEVKLLWLQEQVHRGRLQVLKVSGIRNIADTLTKFHSVSSLQSLMKPHGITFGPASRDCWAEGGCEQKYSEGEVPACQCVASARVCVLQR